MTWLIAFGAINVGFLLGAWWSSRPSTEPSRSAGCDRLHREDLLPSGDTGAGGGQPGPDEFAGQEPESEPIVITVDQEETLLALLSELVKKPRTCSSHPWRSLPSTRIDRSRVNF